MSVIRLAETEAAGRFLGVASDFIGTLPDGRLGDHPRYYQHIIGAHIVSLVQKYGITAIVTSGESGYCGHPDHVVTHFGAIDAQARLAEVGRRITVLALERNSIGTFRVPVDPLRKSRALSIHRSQMPVGADGSMLSQKFFADYPHYLALFEAETYELMMPK